LKTIIEEVIWIQNKNHQAALSHRRRCERELLILN
jgi:hypothetical protein